jgi:hypothetical protein
LRCHDEASRRIPREPVDHGRTVDNSVTRTGSSVPTDPGAPSASSTAPEVTAPPPRSLPAPPRSRRRHRKKPGPHRKPGRPGPTAA